MQDPHIYNELDKNSTRYDELTKILKEHEHLFEWKSGEKILDAGCGPGDITANVLLPWLPSDIQSLLGVDISSTVVEYAQTNHSSDKVSFTILDISSDILEILQNKNVSDGFNKIFSFYLVPWIENLTKGLNNFYTLLKPGGQVFLVFPVSPPIQRAYISVCARQPWAKYFKGIERKILEFPGEPGPSSMFQEIMFSCGFEVFFCELREQCSILDSIVSMKGLTETLDQHIGHVPTDLKEQYLNDCIQEMKDWNEIELQEHKVIYKHNNIIALAKKPGL